MNVRALNTLDEAKEEVQEKLKVAELAGDWMVGIWHKNVDGKLMFHRISFTFPDELSEHALFLLAQDLTQNRIRNTVTEATPLRRVTLHDSDLIKEKVPFLGLPMSGARTEEEILPEIKEGDVE